MSEREDLQTIEKVCSKEEIADVIYCLKLRRDGLFNSIRFFNEIIKDSSVRRLDILENCIIGYKEEANRIELLILKLQNLL